MRVTIPVRFDPDEHVCETEHAVQVMPTAALNAVRDAVRCDDLDLEVRAVEPWTSVGQAAADRVLTGRGAADVDVTVEGSTADVQELVRRWEEAGR